MALDYVLKFPCEVRRQVPEDQLTTLVGYMSLAEFAVAQLRQRNPDESMESILGNYQVQVQQTRPDGTVTQAPMTIGQLVAQARTLAPYRAHCAECRANIADRPFGCIAKINYPIRRETEEWLLARLPADAANPNLQLLLRFLPEFKVDGRGVDALRERLFEHKQPLARRWTTAQGERHITSSQLLELLGFGGPIGPDQADLYARMLGLASVLSEPHPPSEQIEQFKTLMCAIVMAGRLKSWVGVDS